MVANTPGNGALFRGGTGLVGLAFNAQIHNVVAADGAVIDLRRREESTAVGIDLRELAARKKRIVTKKQKDAELAQHVPQCPRPRELPRSISSLQTSS